MPELGFTSPRERLKRQKALNAEYEALMATYSRKRQPAPLPEPVPVTETTIYFIQGRDGGPVKIGLSDYPDLRLRALQMASPVELVIRASIKAARAVERQYHARFAEHRLHGEWFSPHPDILAEIERLSA